MTPPDVHVYFHFNDQVHEFASLSAQLTKLLKQGELTMGSVQDLKDAIAAEHAEVQSMLSALRQSILDLQAQIAAGVPVTSADLDMLIASVRAISDPDVPATT